MKITRYAMMLAAATGLLSACQKLDEVKAYDPDKVVAPVLHALPGEIVITPDNMGSTQTFTWDAADFGVRTQINYSIEASYNDGAKLVLFTGMNGTSSEQTYESLNNILALSVEDGGLGVPSGEPTDVDFYISATIGTDFEKFYSAPVTVRMTVTTAERTYPTVWVIGDYCGWNHGNSQFLFSFSGDEITYEAIVDFGEKAANGFKLTGIAGWDDTCNWGTDGDAPAPDPEAASISLISSGGSGNIMAYSKRFYRLVFDRSTLTLSNKLSFNSMGIIGDATPGGWDTDTEMNFDTQKQRFWVDVTLSAGEFKFRADNDWTINFGGADGHLSQNGDNIKATAGNYRVYATLNNSAEITYELNAGDYGAGGGEEPDPGPETADWYIHGQTVATPDWGPTAMESASSNIVAYKAAGIEVAANSEFLFKSGDECVRTPILWDKAGNELASGSLSGKIDMQMLTAAISVEAQADDDGSLLNLYRTFARLRNTYPVLAQGKMVKHPVYNDGNTSQQSIAAWYRELDGERMLVVHNFGQETQILTLTDQPDKAVGVSGEVKLQRGDASSKLLMGAWSSVVFAL